MKILDSWIEYQCKAQQQKGGICSRARHLDEVGLLEGLKKLLLEPKKFIQMDRKGIQNLWLKLLAENIQRPFNVSTRFDFRCRESKQRPPGDRNCRNWKTQKYIILEVVVKYDRIFTTGAVFHGFRKC